MSETHSHATGRPTLASPIIILMPPIDSYLVFDFETTGLDPRTERIIQIGLCKVSGGVAVERSGWLVNQDIEVPPAARQVHGITTADIRARGIPPHDSLARLLEALSAAHACVGHNIHQFDILFLYAECRRLGMPAPEFGRHVDTAALFKGWKLNLPRKTGETHKQYTDRVLAIRAPGLKYSLSACLAALGIRAESTRLHEAGSDAYLTHLIFETLKKVAPVNA